MKDSRSSAVRVFEHFPITAPVFTLNALNSDNVPWRMYSNSTRPFCGPCWLCRMFALQRLHASLLIYAQDGAPGGRKEVEFYDIVDLIAKSRINAVEPHLLLVRL